MKGIFDFLFYKKRLYLFTERLSLLVCGGNSLQKALFVISRINGRDIKINHIGSFLHKSLLEGTKFSVAMSLSPFLKVPEWYVSFISVAEECGLLSPLLLYLKKLLEHEKSANEKLFSALIYPLLVVLLTFLAGAVSVFYFLPSFSAFWDGEIEEVLQEAIKTMIFADFFLIFSFAAIVVFMKKIVSCSPCVNVFRTIAFLSENSVPIFHSLSCSFAFSGKNKRLSLALLEIKNRLLEGENVAQCFGECFVKSGFKNEGLLLSENLALCEQTGKSDGFERTALFLETEAERNEKIFLSCLQPLLLFLAAIYVTLILKTAFLPYITNFGGLI